MFHILRSIPRYLEKKAMFMQHLLVILSSTRRCQIIQVTFPVYRGILSEGDSIDLQFQTIGKIRKNVTSPKDSDTIARKVMAPYGGIPADAVFEGAETEYVEQYNGTSDKVEAQWPVVTSVSYFRLINNRYVIGDGNRINLDLW